MTIIINYIISHVTYQSEYALRGRSFEYLSGNLNCSLNLLALKASLYSRVYFLIVRWGTTATAPTPWIPKVKMFSNWNFSFSPAYHLRMQKSIQQFNNFILPLGFHFPCNKGSEVDWNPNPSNPPTLISMRRYAGVKQQCTALLTAWVIVVMVINATWLFYLKHLYKNLKVPNFYWYLINKTNN